MASDEPRLFFHPGSGDFYASDVHATMPDDVVRISRARHARLLAARAAGAVIVADEAGRPHARQIRVTLAERRQHAAVRLKREASRRIERAVPLWRQSNDNAQLAIAALSGDGPGQFAALLARRAEIDRLRQRSDAIEAEIAVMTADALLAFDVRADEHWSV